MQKRIGIIGTFIRDTIITLDGHSVESLGGLYHAVSYLAHLADADTRIHPLCHVGEDFYDTVYRVLSGCGEKMVLESLLPHPQANTQVKLMYRSQETRDEITSPTMPPIASEQIQALAGCEAVLVNLISGNDISLDALKSLRKLTPSPLIYLDLHSLALGIDAAGRRYYREVPDWREWVAVCDILQLNEREAATLAGWNESGAPTDLLAFGKKLLDEKLMACHITLGSAGSLLFYQSAGKRHGVHFQSNKISHVIDTIGCGDAFGAAFLINFLKTKNFLMATQFANKIAGLNCTFMGSLTPEMFQTSVKPHLEEILRPCKY